MMQYLYKNKKKELQKYSESIEKNYIFTENDKFGKLLN